MKYLIYILFAAFCILGTSVSSLSQTEKFGNEEIKMFQQHQIYLEKPAISIQDLKYEKDDVKIKGNLSQDRSRIIMDTYDHKGRVSFTVNYADGTFETLSVGSCFIDPVIPL